MCDYFSSFDYVSSLNVCLHVLSLSTLWHPVHCHTGHLFLGSRSIRLATLLLLIVGDNVDQWLAHVPVSSPVKDDLTDVGVSCHEARKVTK